MGMKWVGRFATGFCPEERDGGRGLFCRKVAGLLLLLSVAGWTTDSLAQTAPPHPVDGTQVEQRRQRGTERPKAVDIPVPETPAAQPEEQPSLGVLTGVELRGVTVYEPRDLAPNPARW